MSQKKQEKYRKDVDLLMKDIKEKKVTVLSKQEKEDNSYTKEAQKKLSMYDGWKNAYTGLGSTQDKSYHSYFSGINVLSFKMLSEIWIGDGYGKRIVEVPADDMTREWITIENDEDSLILKKLEKIKTECNCNLALKWKRLLGGGLIVIGVNDGRELHESVNKNNIKSIDWLRTYDRSDIQLTDFNFTREINDPNYGEVEFFTVTPRYGTFFNVHRDRCLIFKGIPVPSRVETGDFWYWGMSAIQPIWDEIKNFGSGKNHVVKLLYEFIIGKYKLKDLAELLAEGNEDKLRTRMNAIDLGKSIIHSVLLDTEEDYVRESATVSGLADLLDRFMIFLAGISGIPVTRLFGRSPAGENATGKGDEGVYYDTIKPMQKNDLKPQLQKLIDLINLSKEIRGNKLVENPTVIFNPLIQLSQKEIQESRKDQAEIDKIYYEAGILTDQEIRESRFGNGYSFDTTLMEEEFEEEEDKPIEEK